MQKGLNEPEGVLLLESPPASAAFPEGEKRKGEIEK